MFPYVEIYSLYCSSIELPSFAHIFFSFISLSFILAKCLIRLENIIREFWKFDYNEIYLVLACSRRHFGLARNLIRRIISPNQVDLSYSYWISFPGQQKLGKLPNTLSLPGQRRPVQTSHWRLFNSSSSMDT